MFGLLVAIIYTAFISLGLPDSLLGSAWSVISVDLGAPISAAGAITMIIACSTIVSSLFSNFLTNKLGTGLLTALSVFLTALALLGFSFATEFWHLCVIAVPYGLGAGAVDAALNNYAAIHFSSRHMNWLHCFWGVGAAISPYIMGFCLSRGFGWQTGYRSVSVLQAVLTVVLFASLPLWKKQKAKTLEAVVPAKTRDALKIKSVWLVFVLFFAYCALEQTAMLWASSYLAMYRGVEANLAATFATLFCTGITVGRFVCGLFSDKVGDKALIRTGAIVTCVGIVAIALPFNTNVVALGGFVVIGLGCAPIYPAVIHSTPINFGQENSQAIVGIQMAFAYVGTTFMPPLFGLLINYGSWVLPVFLSVFAMILIVLSETVNAAVAKRNKTVQQQTLIQGGDENL
ncbi:MAG: MFS transporter [Corallococcus sp.]|nr:MFS transporter [Corallococcus sp.]MCM1359935.1 MFS transporter [Corallococcus sp.]